MRLLQIDSGRQMRGGQWQAFYLTMGLAEAGHEVTLLAPAESPLFHQALGQKLNVQRLSPARLRKLSASCDLTHVHDAASHTLAALLARSPLVVSRRVSFPVKRGFPSRWKYSQAARFIAISRNVEAMLRQAGIPGDKISVVYDGVPLPPNFELPEIRQGLHVIAPETSDPLKGSDLVRQAADLAGISVHFSRTLGEDLAKADILLYLSRSEGLGSGVLLAMAAGVPVIASRVGGLTELIESGVSGLLTANEPEEIALCLRRLIADRHFAKRLACQARKNVEERFSLAAMVSGTERVYEGVLQC